MKLTSDAVTAIIKDCLYKDEELAGLEEGKPPVGCVIVEGIMSKFGFHPGRLDAHKQEIIDLLKELPTEFRKNGGGGWTFLNACNDKDGNQWTGFHKSMEDLFVLGIAIGKAKFQMPREMWKVLPGGMPYIVIDVE